MIVECNWESYQLTHGMCHCCGVETDEIVIGLDRCVECVEAERFYEDVIDNQNYYEEFSFKNF